jgi:hypothetical protein
MYVDIFKHWIYCVHIVAVSVWVDPPASVMTYKSSAWSLVTLILLTAKKHIAECFQINIYKMVFCMPFLPWMLLGHIHLVAPFFLVVCMVARLACLWNLSFSFIESGHTCITGDKSIHGETNVPHGPKRCFTDLVTEAESINNRNLWSRFECSEFVFWKNIVQLKWANRKETLYF